MKQKTGFLCHPALRCNVCVCSSTISTIAKAKATPSSPSSSFSSSSSSFSLLLLLFFFSAGAGQLYWFLFSSYSTSSSSLLRRFGMCIYVHVHFPIWDAGDIMFNFDQVGSNPISGCPGRARVTGFPSLFSFSTSSLLLPSLLPLLLSFFSPSPSLFSFSPLSLSRRPGKKKEKKAPRRGGVWGGAPVLKWFPQKARRKKKSI